MGTVLTDSPNLGESVRTVPMTQKSSCYGFRFHCITKLKGTETRWRSAILKAVNGLAVEKHIDEEQKLIAERKKEKV